MTKQVLKDKLLRKVRPQQCMTHTDQHTDQHADAPSRIRHRALISWGNLKPIYATGTFSKTYRIAYTNTQWRLQQYLPPNTDDPNIEAAVKAGANGTREVDFWVDMNRPTDFDTAKGQLSRYCVESNPNANEA